jgi:CsoR family transcriptional regulator, copper-sensing transcriptional repressor
MARHATHRDQLDRLHRIEGQVKGLIGMVENERYCVEILTQLRAVRSALKAVERQILRTHVAHCVADAVRSGRRAARDEKIDELLAVLGRFGE